MTRTSACHHWWTAADWNGCLLCERLDAIRTFVERVEGRAMGYPDMSVGNAYRRALREELAELEANL